jgi:hypothetical protein
MSDSYFGADLEWELDLKIGGERKVEEMDVETPKVRARK